MSGCLVQFRLFTLPGYSLRYLRESTSPVASLLGLSAPPGQILSNDETLLIVPLDLSFFLALSAGSGSPGQRQVIES